MRNTEESLVQARYQQYFMKSWHIIIALLVLVFVCGCEDKKLETYETGKRREDIEMEETAYTLLLKKVQEDNCNLIASKDDKNVSLMQSIIHTNKFNIDVEDYNNIEQWPDLCHYSKSTKKVVAIIDVTKRNEKNYYISYYIGPEGGASKEILLEKRNGKWIIVNDDGMWSVK
jgi:hypothetical protein